MASANFKTVAVRFTRSLMLNTGKKINHLDSDDSESDEHSHEKTATNWMAVAKKTLTTSNSFTLLRSLASDSDLNGDNENHNLEEFEEKQIFHIDDDFELLPSTEHGTVLFH